MLALFLSTTPAWAVDCGDTARQPVIQKICADKTLRDLDNRVGHLARQYARHTETPNASRTRDQANWQAETLAAGWQAIATDQPLAPTLAARFRERIAYLSSRMRDGGTDTPAHRLATALASGDGRSIRALDGLARADDIKLAPQGKTNRYDSPAAAFAALDAKPSPALRQASTARFADGSLALQWLPGARIGVLFQQQGTAHCFSGQWFRVDESGRAQTLAAPPGLSLDGPDSCGIHVAIARIAGKPAALRIDSPDIDQDTITLQTLNDDAWQTPHRIIVRYDHRLGEPRVVHRQDSGAAFWRKLALPMVQAFDRHPAPGFTAPALSPADADRISDLRTKVEAAAKGASYPPAPLTDQDTDGPLAPYNAFGETAVYFPLAARGNWLLGRIGHGHWGWRSGNGWLVGFWTLDADGNPVPLASLYVPRERERVLGTAVIDGPSTD
ncbi:hypothetical protein [Salinisphaera sp. Q1T1-3]|uniref:hypothetical protein n=1 Tax=Salinisphaera sp. Q1T1-3 TaxID=2321229 RepID=UPI000E717776|nr:hypothetical protein [Salinisphaera sp. Q1T1-3]RJS94094.1 hypothetical protein D3260_05875 [Salinisphaera sp. Q1T1-3]